MFVALRASLYHCTALRCLMNGSNHQEERDARLLHLCPVCLRKLCWNLQVEAVPYLMRMEAFSRRHWFAGEEGWYAKACETLTT